MGSSDWGISLDLCDMGMITTHKLGLTQGIICVLISAVDDRHMRL